MYKTTFIILGAHFSERHIKEFIKQNKNNDIITVSDIESNNETSPINCIHYTTNFNKIAFWKFLFEELISSVVHVIVDISTAKHMDKEKWNFEGESNIASIVLRLIRNRNGSFTSPCCGTGAVFVIHGVREYDHLVYINSKPEFLVDSSFTPFKKAMSLALEKRNFHLDWYVNNATTPYPLHNVQISLNSDFFIIRS